MDYKADSKGSIPYIIYGIYGIWSMPSVFKSHIPNIDALNSDTHTLFLSILIMNSQYADVAIEGMDIWYMGLKIGASDVGYNVSTTM